MNTPDPTSATTQQREGSGRSRVAAIVAGPALALLVYGVLGFALSGHDGGLTEAGRRAAAVLVWMATWWLTEALPLPATSLLPLVLLPLLGILSPRAAAQEYGGRVIFLFLGGFILALGMERWNVHRRLALRTVLLVGTSPVRIVAGFMIATALLSMWMSNTATTIMLIPIGQSLVLLMARRSDRPAGHFGVCLMLGIAYAASIGGIATPIGTPPNTYLLQFLLDEPYNHEISFLRWMLVALPIVAVFLPITWLLLTRVLFPLDSEELPGGRSVIRNELAGLGPMSRGERAVLAVFGGAVSAWLLRGLLREWTPGPGSAFSWLPGFLRHNLDDTSIAIAAALALFVIPVDLSRREFVMDWKTARRLPWGILLLFGGGLSLARAIETSGLSAWIGTLVGSMQAVPTIVLVLAVVVAIVFLTEVTSNTATATIFFPILAGVAVTGFGIDPLVLLVPAAIGASCAFMMPVATPPNAIVFASGYVTMRQMARAGIWLNLISITLITLAAMTVLRWGLGVEFHGLPEWVTPPPVPAP